MDKKAHAEKIAAAKAVYDALARLSIVAPEIGRHPAMCEARNRAYDRLIKVSEMV